MKSFATKLVLSITLIAIYTATATAPASAQQRQQKVQVLLIPDDSDAVYETGQKAKLKVMAR